MWVLWLSLSSLLSYKMYFCLFCCTDNSLKMCQTNLEKYLSCGRQNQNQFNHTKFVIIITITVLSRTLNLPESACLEYCLKLEWKVRKIEMSSWSSFLSPPLISLLPLHHRYDSSLTLICIPNLLSVMKMVADKTVVIITGTIITMATLVHHHHHYHHNYHYIIIIINMLHWSQPASPEAVWGLTGEPRTW